LVVREAERLVHALFGRSMFRQDVFEAVSTNPSIGESVRREAFTLAEQLPENPTALNFVAWMVVRQPGADRAALRLALRQAETASRLAPGDGGILNTLGLAQYRLGMDEEAVASLTRADELNRMAQDSSNPADLAFLALAYHRLGRADQARAAVSRLRETMKRPQWGHGNQFHVPLADLVHEEKMKSPLWGEDSEAVSFLSEAETVEMDLAFPGEVIHP
jgi:hypothetical protein